MCERNIAINSYILLMITVGHLFELNRCKPKYDTVLTGRVTSFVDDMQIHHAFQQESIYHFLKFAACALIEGASCVHFAPTVGEKKIARKYPERLDFLYTDKNIETCEKRN